jgi:hypothetical protein
MSVVADFPDDDVAVAILINSRMLNLDLGLQLTNRVLGAVFDEPGSRWGDPPEIPYPEM